MTYHFKCTLCGEEYEAGQVHYVCPKDGDDGVLDTIFDYKKSQRRLLQRRSPIRAIIPSGVTLICYRSTIRANPHRHFKSAGRRYITRPKQASNLV